MERTKQYEALIEIMANARLLSALSDNDKVVENNMNIRTFAVNAAVELGYSDVKFNSDSIVRYRELLEKIK